MTTQACCQTPSVTEPQRDRRPLQMPCGHLSIAVAMAYHQPFGLDIIKAGALYIIARSVHIRPLPIDEMRAIFCCHS